MASSLHIEFTGISGAGKTTTFIEVCKELERRNITFENLNLINSRKINAYNLFILLKCLYLVFSLKPNGLKGLKKIFKHIVSFKIRYSASSNKYKTHLLDEGIFHKIRDISRHSKEKEMIKIAEKVFKSINTPDIVISIEANADIIFKRRIKRDRKNDVIDYRVISIYVSQYNETIETIEYVRDNKKKKLELVRIKNESDDDIENNAKIIVDEIEKQLFFKNNIK